MSLLFFDGFQDPVLMPKPEWSGNSFLAITGRDGVANSAGRQYSSSSPQTRTLTLPSPAATAIFGTAWLLTGYAWWSIAFSNDGGATQQLHMVVNGSGFIEIRRTTRAGTLLGTSSGHAPIVTSDWHYYEAKVVLNASGAGSCIVQLDGLTVLTLTGVTTSSVTASVNAIMLIQPGSSGLTAYFDDLYVCDAVDATTTQGRANNDFLGDIRVASLFPSAAGDSTGWTPSVGANYTTVDENPANLTDYVSAVATTPGTRDLYQLGDLTGTISAVYGVRVGLYVMKSDAGNALVKPVLKETGGTVTAQAAQAVSFVANPIYGPMLPTKPSAPTTAWTTTDINALQAGQEVA